MNKATTWLGDTKELSVPEMKDSNGSEEELKPGIQEGIQLKAAFCDIKGVGTLLYMQCRAIKKIK